MGPVYRLTLRQVSGRWRLLIMTLLALMPVAITAIVLADGDAPGMAEYEEIVLSTLLAGAIAPFVVLAIAAPAFANELEDRTLANLTLTPIPRWRIVLPKLLGSITVAAPFLLFSTVATAWLAFMGDLQAVAAVTAAVVVGVVLYASAFLWLGLVTTQAIGVGLLYVVLWEGFFAGFVQGVRLFSIRHLTIALMNGLDPRRFAGGTHLELFTVLAVAAVVVGGFLFLSVRRLRQIDIP